MLESTGCFAITQHSYKVPGVSQSHKARTTCNGLFPCSQAITGDKVDYNNSEAHMRTISRVTDPCPWHGGGGTANAEK